MRSIHAVPVLCAVLALAASRARAQAPDPDLPLARATATAILHWMRSERLFLIVPPPGRFDTLTAVELLAQAPRRQDPESDYALYIGTRGATVFADSAVVTVVMHKQEHRTGLNWWEEVDEYRFVRDGDGWRFVNQRPISHADGGSVRGALFRSSPPWHSEQYAGAPAAGRRT